MFIFLLVLSNVLGGCWVCRDLEGCHDLSSDFLGEKLHRYIMSHTAMLPCSAVFMTEGIFIVGYLWISNINIFLSTFVFIFNNRKCKHTGGSNHRYQQSWQSTQNKIKFQERYNYLQTVKSLRHSYRVHNVMIFQGEVGVNKTISSWYITVEENVPHPLPYKVGE